MRKLSSKSWQEKLADRSDNYHLIIDDSDSSNTYVGKAPPGTTTSSKGWMLFKIVEDGTTTSIIHAEGTDEKLFTWEDRASYSYS